MVGMLVGVWSVWWSVCGRYGGRCVAGILLGMVVGVWPVFCSVCGRYGGWCVVCMVGGKQHHWKPCPDKRQAELEAIAVTAEI